jgi:phosphoglucomutase
VMNEHWTRFGRSYFQRHDYERLNAGPAHQMLEEVRASLDSLIGADLGGARVVKADDFSYTDPVDHSITPHTGMRIFLEDGSRVVFRLSGTGTEGATLRIYVERFSTRWDADVSAMVEPLARAVRQFLRLRERFGRDEPDVVT